MNNEPTKTPDRVLPTEARPRAGDLPSSESKPTQPDSNPTLRDPAPIDYGDKTDDALNRVDSANPNDNSARGNEPRSAVKAEEDAGEGHKGPRVDATTVASDHRPPGDRPIQPSRQTKPNQPNQLSETTHQLQKPAQVDAHAKSDSDCCSSDKEAATNPVGTHSGGAAAV